MSIKTVLVGHKRLRTGIASAEQVAEARRLLGNSFDTRVIARESRQRDSIVMEQLEAKLVPNR